MIRRWTPIACLLLLTASTALGAPYTAIEKKAREIEATLIAPCCWRQPLNAHESPEANSMKREIRRLLADGKTEKQIQDRYVAIYGERILTAPRASGFNLMAYLGPALALLFGAGVVGMVVRRWKNRRPEGASETAGPSGQADPPADTVSPELLRRLEAELKELD